MSRHIVIAATYLNGKKAFAGWYCPKNADMVESEFDHAEWSTLLAELTERVNGRKIRSLIAVNIITSDSKGESVKSRFHVHKDVIKDEKYFKWVKSSIDPAQ